MEGMLKQILVKLDKLDKLESKVDKIDLDVAAIRNDVRQIDRKIDSITEVVAKTMEDIIV